MKLLKIKSILNADIIKENGMQQEEKYFCK